MNAKGIAMSMDFIFKDEMNDCFSSVLLISISAY